MTERSAVFVKSEVLNGIILLLKCAYANRLFPRSSSETVEEEILGKTAKALEVTPQAIKNFNEDDIINYFHDQSSFNFQGAFNPLAKALEASVVYLL